jgi:hypothetical protein
MRRLISATLLLYPRAVRQGHGAELESLVQELIDRDGASRPRVVTRLALDGLTQRLSTRATAVVLAGTLALTSIGGLAVSDFAAASAHGTVPARRVQTPGTRALSTHSPRQPVHVKRPRHATRRSAGIIKR